MFEEAGENSRIGNQEFGIENWEFENLHTYRFSKCLVPLLKGPKFSKTNLFIIIVGWASGRPKKTKCQM
jgi:hypothetical protein